MSPGEHTPDFVEKIVMDTSLNERAFISFENSRIMVKGLERMYQN
jgi:hypothetical protein